MINCVAFIWRNVMKKNTTIRINDNTINYYKSFYKTVHAGCVMACESFPKMKAEAARNLMSNLRLEKDEKKMVFYACRDTVIDRVNISSVKVWEAELYDAFQDTDSPIKSKHDFEKLIKKLRTLGIMERFVLRESCLGVTNELKNI